ncbi:MAG: DUF3850 domain-containing protein [Candidatus Micrarchaeota archaeon]|nr:DUF3850 domain-containing protein [Candidatus Micrarchaeota archaeon]
MAAVEKKIWPEFFELVLSGKKKLEVRLADFSIKKGDSFVLAEFDPKKRKYTGKRIKKRVKNIIKFDPLRFWNANELKKHGIYIIEF